MSPKNVSSAMPELRTDVEIIVADVSVEESLAAMCRRGLLVLNCVGPVSMMSSGRCHLLKNKNNSVPNGGWLCLLSTGSTESRWSKPVLQTELTTWTSAASRRLENKPHGFHSLRLLRRLERAFASLRVTCVFSSWSECSWSTTPKPRPRACT